MRLFRLKPYNKYIIVFWVFVLLFLCLQLLGISPNSADSDISQIHIGEQNASSHIADISGNKETLFINSERIGQNFDFLGAAQCVFISLAFSLLLLSKKSKKLTGRSDRNISFILKKLKISILSYYLGSNSPPPAQQ